MYTARSEPGRVDLGKDRKEGSWSAQAWVARGTSRGMGVPVERLVGARLRFPPLLPELPISKVPGLEVNTQAPPALLPLCHSGSLSPVQVPRVPWENP